MAPWREPYVRIRLRLLATTDKLRVGPLLFKSLLISSKNMAQALY